MRVLITAGPTHEPLDPVRFLANRSSGKMGYALAAAAAERDHDVVLVSGPVALDVPKGVELVAVETAAEMFDAVRDSIAGCDLAIMAAAVADYTPAEVAEQKIKKGGREMTLRLVRTRDILGSMRDELGFVGTLVGFAAETENLRDNALGKLRGKGCDFVVANDVSRGDIGFGGEDNEVVIFAADGSERPISKGPKAEVARAILAKVTEHAGVNETR